MSIAIVRSGVASRLHSRTSDTEAYVSCIGARSRIRPELRGAQSFSGRRGKGVLKQHSRPITSGSRHGSAQAGMGGEFARESREECTHAFRCLMRADQVRRDRARTGGRGWPHVWMGAESGSNECSMRGEGPAVSRHSRRRHTEGGGIDVGFF